MSVFQFALAVAALLIGGSGVYFRRWRAVSWLCVLALGFVSTVAYYRLGGAGHWVANAVADAAIFVAIYFTGRTRWEEFLQTIFFCMVVTSLLFAVHIVPSHYAYVVLLEAWNWLALATIGIPIAREEVVADVLARCRLSGFGIRRLVRAAHKSRSTPAFTQSEKHRSHKAR